MDDFETFTIPGRRARKIDFLVMGIGFVKDACEVLASNLEGVQDLLCMHANWLFDREQFHEEAAMELETLLVGDEDWDESGDEPC